MQWNITQFNERAILSTGKHRFKLVLFITITLFFLSCWPSSGFAVRVSRLSLNEIQQRADVVLTARVTKISTRKDKK